MTDKDFVRVDDSNIYLLHPGCFPEPLINQKQSKSPRRLDMHRKIDAEIRSCARHMGAVYLQHALQQGSEVDRKSIAEQSMGMARAVVSEMIKQNVFAYD